MGHLIHQLGHCRQVRNNKNAETPPIQSRQTYRSGAVVLLGKVEVYIIVVLGPTISMDSGTLWTLGMITRIKGTQFQTNGIPTAQKIARPA
jgi:hypothetical protein